MTYYTTNGEFHFEFGLDNCGANFPYSARVPGTDGQGNCFYDIDAFPTSSQDSVNLGERSGHWDINWEGVATDCAPGLTGCSGAPTNNMELDAHFGGPLDISGLEGAGNLLMVYDQANNNWKIASADPGIPYPLNPLAPGVVAMSTYTSNLIQGGTVETNLNDARGFGSGYAAQSYVIDLATNSLGSNVGFGGALFGTNTGEFNMICVTTAGHVMFLEATTPRCNPDAAQTAAGGQWQGFALGAGEFNFQYQGNGMLYQIRDIHPDQDSTPPAIVGGVLGDSHALERRITATISDTELYGYGLNTNPTPGIGPTAHVTVTSDDGTVTTSALKLDPVGYERNNCVENACDWAVNLTDLVKR